MKGRINIGTASIILIFIILCLSVFSLLSLSDAKSAEVFARRRADSVKSYYQTDRLGQQFVKAASEAIKSSTDTDDAVKQVKTELSDDFSVSANEKGNLDCNISMAAGQSLYVELDGRSATVLSYYVYISEDYAIDNKLPVWTGNE